MKLKIRVGEKEFSLFILFAIALLYLIAIGVLNVSSLASRMEFHGFNPLPAFTTDLIWPTLVFFFFTLAYIFLSVSSKIFSFEKGGPGFQIGAKKENKYSRWATEKEMKKELKKVLPAAETSEYAGIPIINNGKEIWVDNGDYHNLIIGSTGSGKTEMIVQPMVKVLAKKGESMIITDPKGEIYEKNAVELREKGYNVIILNFRDPQRGNSWNPLTLPYSLYKSGNSDKATELLDDLAKNILYDENSQGQDPFWDNTSADYFAGIALALFEDAKEEEINLNSINLVTTVGEEKLKGTTYIKEYFSEKPQSSPAYINVVSTLMAASDTKSSILSVFKQKIKLFSSRENLSEMLSRSDFDMRDIGRQKTAVFIVIQDEKKTYHSLVTIFIKQCYETLISVAQECGGKLPYRTNFILDEFANMPPLKDVTTMVTAARSRAIRFSFIIQNFAQLYQVYGKDNGETIKGNCGNIIYLISSELAALEEISKMCGEEKSKDKDKTVSTPLVTVSDLQRIPRWTTITLRIRQMPFKTKMTPNFELVQKQAWGKDYPLADYPQRDKKPVEIFDLKKFVNERKERKLEAALNEVTENAKSNPMDELGIGSPNGGAPDISALMSEFSSEELLAKIDAKIAELEAEEERERQMMEQQAKEAAMIVKESPVEEAMPSVVEPTKPKSSVNPGFLDIDKIAMSAKDIFSGEAANVVVPEVNENADVVSFEPLEREIPDISDVIQSEPIDSLTNNFGSIYEEGNATDYPRVDEDEGSVSGNTSEPRKPRFITVPVIDEVETPVAQNTKPAGMEIPNKRTVISDDQFFDDFFNDDF